MSIRRHCRRSYIQYLRRLRTILYYGRLPRLRIATSARAYCGASPGREWGARNAGSSATRSARTYWTPIVCSVSITLSFPFLHWQCVLMFRCRWEELQAWCWGQGQFDHYSNEGSHEATWARKAGNIWIDQVMLWKKTSFVAGADIHTHLYMIHIYLSALSIDFNWIVIDDIF